MAKRLWQRDLLVLPNFMQPFLFDSPGCTFVLISKVLVYLYRLETGDWPHLREVQS